ncbi:DUF6286 domain-containing protein [Streptomyces sp. SAJ15]|uniref:DUF6286 domain-containing protein n=1 Tax=Streptomyces sp. SAJ15 TaxID=2011095 RepID=UPI0011869114|nr:DUF6286 domain-containing protein [Streptomyces sp. SAJ15]TVL90976.1 hypothetical protein CD790_19235 [Streptomyces sp. SAJ15]
MGVAARTGDPGDSRPTGGTRGAGDARGNGGPGAGVEAAGAAPPEKPAPGEPAPGSVRPRPVRRFWSTRRVPAAIVAALVLAGTGLLLYDVAAVRAGRPAMRWRRELADELATRPLDSGWVVGAAAVVLLVGCWLVVLAVTPGLRRLLPMRRDSPDVRAGLDRGAAGLVLRDRAMEVAGVRSVRVDVGRRRVRARVVSHFRDLDDVRADLDRVLAEGVRQLGLARQPALSLRVRRPSKG